MKTVKALLLGTAAAIVVSGSSQAADVMVKAKPIEYVKVCEMYGPDFYQLPWMPDLCIKIGGTVRFDIGANADGNGGPFVSGTTGRNESFDTSDVLFQGRGTAWMDVRQMTGYGPLRGYLSVAGEGSVEASGSTYANSFYMKDAFVDFWGGRVGKAQSLFDFHNGDYSYGSYHFGGGSNTYDAGIFQANYTARLGGGFSASLGVEDGSTRRTALWDAGTNGMAIGSFPGPNTLPDLSGLYPACGTGAVTADQNIGNTAAPFSIGSTCAIGDYAAQQMPDIVGRLRVDQGWGSAQLAGALHQVAGNYYGNDTQTAIILGPNAFTGIRPADAMGFAAMGGVTVNLPTGPGDTVWTEGVYAHGAVSYTGVSQIDSFAFFNQFNGGTVGAGWALDGVFANAVSPTAASPAVGGTSNFTGIILSDAWSVGAAYEHHWNPGLRTSLFGTYFAWDAPPNMNAVMCDSPNGPVRIVGAPPLTPNYAFTPISGGAIAGCNYSFSVAAIGTRTIWNPVKNLDVGFEIMYSQLYQNMNPADVVFFFGGAGNRPEGFYSPANQGTWDGLLRVQYHFGDPPPEEDRS
jgi:hypothetical protein